MMHGNNFIDPTDKDVGARVRHRRKSLGMSQSDLAKRIEVTFQQVQKYEKGTNRISASRMQQISLALQLPVASFFSGAGNDGELVTDLAFMSRETLALNRAFIKISSQQARAAVLELVGTLADNA